MQSEALIEEGVQAALAAGVAENGEHGVAAARVAARHVFTSLQARVAELEEALRDALNNGLIYWEPNTPRGHVAKAQMLKRIEDLLGGDHDK